MHGFARTVPHFNESSLVRMLCVLKIADVTLKSD